MKTVVVSNPRRRTSSRWLLVGLALAACGPTTTTDELSRIGARAADGATQQARAEPDCSEAGIETLQQDADGHADAGRSLAEAEARHMLGTCYQDRDEMQPALTHLRSALALADRAGAHDLTRRVMTSLATATNSAGEQAAAIELFERALALHRAAGDAPMAAQTLSNLGLAYTSRGEFDRALETLSQAREYFEEMGETRALGRALVKIGNVHQALGKPDLAIETLQRAIEVCGRARDVEAVAYAGGRVADLLRAAGKPAEAIRQLRIHVETLNTLDRPRLEAYTAITLSQVLLDQGEAEEARHWAERGLALHQQIDNPWGETAAWDDVARARAAVGDIAGALEGSQSGIETLERQRARIGGPDARANFLAANARTAATRLEILLSAHRRFPSDGYVTRALTAHEGALARSLLEYLADDTTGVPPLLGSSFDLERLQEILDPSTRLVAFALGTTHSWAWIVGPERVALVELGARRAIDEAVATLLTERPTGHPMLDGASLTLLADLIWRPLAAAVGPARRLLLVPHGSLQRVPFAALPNLDGEPLVASFELSTSPSAAVAVALTEPGLPAPTGTTVRILADPVYRRSDSRLSSAPDQGGVHLRGRDDQVDPGNDLQRLPRLRFSHSEATTIATIVGSSATQALGFDANKAAVMALERRPSRIVHIAAHAVLNTEEPAQSGIVFSLFDRGGQPRDGLLSLPEIQQLELDVELVVLSACNTAVGKALWGEGLLSLTRGFLAAGASGVVASLWPVDDRATAELMGHFYTALWEDQAPATALRSAQRALAASGRWNEPRHWAGFVYQGRLD